MVSKAKRKLDIPCYLLTNGSMGMISQVTGLGDCISNQVVHAHSTDDHQSLLTNSALNNPSVVIGAGRAALSVMAKLKRQHPHIYTVYTQTPPRTKRHFIDRIVCPKHDNTTGDNVWHTQGALHKIQKTVIEQRRRVEPCMIAHGEKPLVALFVGGKTNRYHWDRQADHLLYQLIECLAATNCHVWISPSRRTMKSTLHMLREIQSFHADHITLVDLENDNPYESMIAHADAFIVTEDSVNMMSELSMSERPLYAYTLPNYPERSPSRRYCRDMLAQNVIRLWDGVLASWSYQCLEETSRIGNLLLHEISSHFHLGEFNDKKDTH